jgi:hypothetical protein
MKRDGTVAVREVPDVINGLQLDKGHAATALPIHHLNLEVCAPRARGKRTPLLDAHE